jgi:hypothetical protein
MISEWKKTPEHCIRALQLYTDSHTKAAEALKELQKQQDDDVREAYRVAMKSNTDGFWNLLASVSDRDPECKGALSDIDSQSDKNPGRLDKARDAYRQKGDLAGVTQLLAGEPDANTRDHYRACFGTAFGVATMFEEIDAKVTLQVKAK